MFNTYKELEEAYGVSVYDALTPYLNPCKDAECDRDGHSHGNCGQQFKLYDDTGRIIYDSANDPSQPLL